MTAPHNQSQPDSERLTFGQPVENIAASEDNPTKRGLFIRSSGSMVEYASPLGVHHTPADNIRPVIHGAKTAEQEPMSDDLCQCPNCGRMHRHLGTPPVSVMEQIARDMRDGVFPKKSEQTLREEAAPAAPRCDVQSATVWQLIETAPRDGSLIDLWITPPPRALSAGDYGRVSDCWFSNGRWWFYNETQYASDPANCRSEVWNVTHWTPRPAGPSSPLSSAHSPSEDGK